MANSQDVRIKPIPITLDKPRTLYYDLNAFVELEEQYGGIEDAIDKMQEGSIKAIRALIWAGLLHEIEEKDLPAFTMREAGKLITFADIEHISDAISKGLGAGLSPAEETIDKMAAATSGVSDAEGNPKMVGTGSGSITSVQSSSVSPKSVSGE